MGEEKNYLRHYLRPWIHSIIKSQKYIVRDAIQVAIWRWMSNSLPSTFNLVHI